MLINGHFTSYIQTRLYLSVDVNVLVITFKVKTASTGRWQRGETVSVTRPTYGNVGLMVSPAGVVSYRRGLSG